jgi:hypothetical protein
VGEAGFGFYGGAAVTEGTEETMSDAVNHPKHYNAHPSGVECVTIAEHFNFNVGNAIKYLWRAGLKASDAREDLQKARWYVERELQRMEAERAG